MRFGLIGYPLSHSFSKEFFTEKFDREGLMGYTYENFPLEAITLLPHLIDRHPDLTGLNVTIPYKEQVIPFLDELDPTATAVGAVNTIRIRKGGLKGYNTDVYGFRRSLEGLLERTGVRLQLAWILGTGGAAKAVRFALDQMGVESVLVSRYRERSTLIYSDIGPGNISDPDLIVNATPLGTHPLEATFPPLPYSFLEPRQILFDLTYNPQKTVYLQKAETRHCIIQNGLEMLHLQAEKSWEIWKT